MTDTELIAALIGLVGVLLSLHGVIIYRRIDKLADRIESSTEALRNHTDRCVAGLKEQTAAQHH